MGLIYPGRPIANVCFKTYGYISMSQAVSFLSDFKLGHYMKIPPRSMFVVQCIGQAAQRIINGSEVDFAEENRVRTPPLCLGPYGISLVKTGPIPKFEFNFNH
ncbi:hypothetical protein OIU84_013089 [Salix udensis]|uniref:Uncharacterized protein n=1 Tax=Salix udensis TaxID=889485 RepID=A0AAD6NUC3_9ROSI|nr:hypothetical protein OIU84_013089 [Salix udensis]